MQRRRKPVNIFRVTALVILVGAALYVNQVVVPTIDPPFVPTPTPTREPESFVTEARALFDEGKISQAVLAYEQAVRSNPTDASIYVALARAQTFAGDFDSAQANAENALLLTPNNAMAHAMRAWALNNKGDYLEAEASVKRALELDPNNAIAHAFYAEILINQNFSGMGGLNTLERAIEQSRLAISLDPNALETHRARGYVLFNTGNYSEALNEYQAAIAINGNIAELHINLGLTYRALGVYDQAISSFTRANALNPSDPNPDLYTSRTFFTVGEFSKAVQFAEQAVNDAPADAFLRGNLGVMYYKNLQFPEAAEQLSLTVGGGVTAEGVQVTPIPLSNSVRISEYYYTYGLALVNLSRCAEALPIFRNILTVVPNNEIAVFNANFGLEACAAAIATPTPAAPAPTPTP